MTSPEKVAANRSNARNSTGPTSTAGKARSSRNAVKHGLTSQPETHPGDPTRAFQESLAEWVGDLKPKGIVQKTLAERACRAAWNLKRCDRYEDAMAAKRERDAAEDFDKNEAARAEAIGRKLLTGRDDESPGSLVGELRGFEAGVAWMLERWAELGRALKDPAGWDESRRNTAVRLLGVRPESARDHPVAAKILPASGDLTMNQFTGSVFDLPAMSLVLEEASSRGNNDPNLLRSECLAALEDQCRGGSRTRSATEAARTKRLRALVRSERGKLLRLQARTLRARASQDRAGASDRSMFDDTKSLALCLRYATAASRDLHRTIADLAKLKKEAEKADDKPSEPSADKPPAPPEKLRNEAKPASTNRPPRTATKGPDVGGWLGSKSRSDVAPGPAVALRAWKVPLRTSTFAKSPRTFVSPSGLLMGCGTLANFSPGGAAVRSPG